MIELSVQVDGDDLGPFLQVRAFLDLDPSLGLGTEVELPLRRTPPGLWHGVFVLPAARREFHYRVGIAGHPSARWWLTLRHRAWRTVLLADGDTLGSNKAWFVGTCRLHPGTVQHQAPA